MNIADYLYVDDYACEKYNDIEKIIVDNRKYVEDSFYAVILNEYTSKLEFEEWVYLQQRHYKLNPPILVGLARDYDSAEKLVCSMIKNCIDNIGSLDYIAYLASMPELEEDGPVLMKVSGGKIND